MKAKLNFLLSVRYEHDFADHRGDPEAIIRFTLKFLFS
jgi:hypothetical protein